MGSKEEDVPKEPVEKTVFVEDMNESELASAVSRIKTYTLCKIHKHLLDLRSHCPVIPCIIH